MKGVPIEKLLCSRGGERALVLGAYMDQFRSSSAMLHPTRPHRQPDAPTETTSGSSNAENILFCSV
eukprot:5935086-Pyramimonas_sp.AAC.1